MLLTCAPDSKKINLFVIWALLNPKWEGTFEPPHYSSISDQIVMNWNDSTYKNPLENQKIIDDGIIMTLA